MNVAKGIPLADINLSARSQTLLGGDVIVVVEEFWSGKRKVEKGDLSGNVIFWEPRELPKTLLSDFPKSWKVENFSIPQVNFKFLDTISPGKPQAALRILHDMQDSDVFSLLPLLSWHIRYLIWANAEPETLNLPSWRVQKLLSQSSKFSLENLYEFHKKLLKLDRSIKTGTNILSPKSSLESLIVNL